MYLQVSSAATAAMRLNNVQTVSRVFTTSVSPSDDAPAPKAVDAPSSRVVQRSALQFRETALQFPRLRAVERAVLVGTVGMVGTAITALVSIQNLSTRGSSRSRRDAEGVYNAITFAFPHVFYPPKIYPAGNRQSLRRAARMMLPLEDASWASSASRSSVA